jgi:hypothetical protein
MDLKRRKPLDEGGDTAMDLIEREAEGVQVDTSTNAPEAKKDSVRSDVRGRVVTEKHLETPARKS